LRLLRAVTLGLMFAVIPWFMMTAAIGGDLPRYMVLPGFWAMWFTPVDEGAKLALLFGVNAAVWTMTWWIVLWISGRVGPWVVDRVECWLGL
jgi:hypothetical protein